MKQSDCLIVIDVQNDFCTGGALAVPDGQAAVPVINATATVFDHRILTQDWHPAEHRSFASNHAGAAAMDTVELDYGTQVLWPDHCVQDSIGAEFHTDLDTSGCEMIIRKGFRPKIDSYFAFFENDYATLTGYLRTRGFDRLYIAGLATDFSVLYSARDGVKEGFNVHVIEDGCRGIDLYGSLDRAYSEMAKAGISLIRSEQLAPN